MAELLLEVGTEELPPAAVAQALEQLNRDARAALKAARLDFGDVHTTGTVRRLVLIAGGLATRQRDETTTVRGPAAKIAYDPAGRPTQAAAGFARAQGVPVDALQVREMDGGRYVVAEIRQVGRPSAEVLAELLPGIVAGLSFPKTMRWAAGGFRFGRPIRRIVALVDRRILRIEIAGVRAGRRTVGHRFLAPAVISLPQAAAHRAAMRRARVMLDAEDRRRRIVALATEAAVRAGGRPVLDPALLEELVWSTEHPTPVLGAIDPEIVAILPRPVVLVTLQHHQKCFGVEDAGGRLMPAFIAVRDGGTSHLATVRTGHEWVVRARLADARFFLEEDRRESFDQWNAALACVAHVAGLGSMADHVQRLQRVASWLAEEAGLTAADRGTLERASQLCKADLVTALVREFPELQGTVGNIYAREAGEPAEVAIAIEEHYWPKASGGETPWSLPGALLSVADRAVLLTGAVLAGLTPSGSQDPYGLRRAAGGIVDILRAHVLKIGLWKLCGVAVSAYDYPDDARAAARATCFELLGQRVRTVLMDQGIAYDTVNATMAVAAGDVPDYVARAQTLHNFSARPEMARVVTAHKRASRIDVQLQSEPLVALDPRKLVEQAEVRLYSVWQNVEDRVNAAVEAREYVKAVEALLELADPVDAFFDDVLVMAPDASLRANRRALLGLITGSFDRVANFSLLAV